MVKDDGALGREEEVVDETGGLLTIRSGVGEGDFDELLVGLELRIDPLAVGVDGGEDLVGG